MDDVDRRTYLPVVDGVTVEWFGSTYSSGAVAPGRMEEDRASVCGVDNDGVRTTAVDIPRPRVRTVVGEDRAS